MRNYPAVGVALLPTVKPNSRQGLAAMAQSWVSMFYEQTVADYVVPDWYDISDRTREVITRRGRLYELGRAESGEATLTVDNSDLLFDPDNTLSPLYGNLYPYRGLQIACAHNGATDDTYLAGNIINDVNTRLAWSNDIAVDTAVATPVNVATNDATFLTATGLNWYRVVQVGSRWSYAATGLSVAADLGLQVLSNSSTPFISRLMLDVPVVAGQTYTFSFKGRATGTASTVKVFDGVALASASAAAAASASITVSASYSSYSVTWTAQSNRAAIVFELAGFAVIRIAEPQVEIRATATAFTTNGLPVYDLFNGFVERYPQSFDAPNRSSSELVAVDLISAMSQVSLENLYIQDTLNQTALAYYPLNSDSDADYASNYAAYNQVPMVWTTEVNAGTGTWGEGTFGDDSSVTGIPAAGTTCAATTWGTTTASPFKYLQALNPVGISFAPETGIATKTYTFEIWYNPSEPDGFLNNYNAPFVIKSPNGQSLVQMFNDFTDQIDVIIGPSDITSPSLTINYNDWNYALVVVTYTTATNNVAVKFYNANSLGEFETTFSGTSTLTDVSALQVAYQSQLKAAHFAIYEGDRWSMRTNRYALGKFAREGERVSDRFIALFPYAGFNYTPIAAQTSESYAGMAIDIEGTALFDAVQAAADTEMSNWYVNGSGVVVFNNRRQRHYQQTPAVTFADTPTGYAYRADEVVLNNDPTYILNSIRVSRLQGVSVLAFDDASVSEYFPRTYERTLNNTSDLETIDAAYYLLDRYKQPKPRIESFRLTPASYIDLWAVLLPLELDQLIEVDKSKLLSGTLWEFLSFIERIEHTLTAATGEWDTDVFVSPQLQTYNMLDAYTTTLATTISSSTGFFNLVLTRNQNNGRDVNNTDFAIGTIFEIQGTTTTYVAVAGYGAMTATTMTFLVHTCDVPNAKTLTSDMNLETLSASLSATMSASTYLIEQEIMSGTVAATTLTVTQRNLYGNPSIHLIGATVYGLTGTTPATTAGVTIKEYTTNDLPSPVQYDELGSVQLPIVAGNSNTTPSSGKTYTRLTFQGLPDYLNTSQTDFANASIFWLGTDQTYSTNEYAGLITSTSLANTSEWYGYFYPLNGTPRYLAADLDISTTTVTLSTAAPAGTNAIIVDNEWMQVTAGAGTTSLTVVRGTPDADTWGIIGIATHTNRDSTTKVWCVTSTAGLVNTYVINSQARVDTTPNLDAFRLTY